MAVSFSAGPIGSNPVPYSGESATNPFQQLPGRSSCRPTEHRASRTQKFRVWAEICCMVGNKPQCPLPVACIRLTKPDNSVPDHVDAEGSATPIHPRSPPARRGSKTGHNKAFSAATSRTDILGVAAACRTGARNRPRLWGSLLAYGWHAIAPYAAILGTLVVYPVLAAVWQRLPRPGRHSR